MKSSLSKLSLAALISASIGLTPLMAVAADAAPINSPVAPSVAPEPTSTVKPDQAAKKKAQKDTKAQKQTAKKAQKKANKQAKKSTKKNAKKKTQPALGSAAVQ
ncbi:protein tyrosine phosphatase [Polynucleobacter brandtiae]|uniref:Protein tyrosine phosphatase n=1 Tax=Polynucleobacter brandtiae TaxID=1938816 RepID=A0A2M8VYQ4_9BURK|nr:protein tyrosine phosphatase [Polynucleobacter brandtiae]PJI82975.1 hypothetical protein B0G85_0365 [Polynucleobacter brandtiae]